MKIGGNLIKPNNVTLLQKIRAQCRVLRLYWLFAFHLFIFNNGAFSKEAINRR